MQIKPSRGILLVKPKKTKEEQQLTESGIILEEKETEKISEGVIVAMGEPKLSKTQVELPYEVAMGDTVMFNRYGREAIAIGGFEHRFITEEDVLLILSTGDSGQE